MVVVDKKLICIMRAKFGLRDVHRNRSGWILGALKGPKVRSEFGSEQRFRRYDRLKLSGPAYLHKAVRG